MKRDGQPWSWQFWMILAVGAWLGAGLGVVRTAEALDLFSGLLKDTTNETHCAVINLSADKDKVLREAFRVLKPGGRFAVSDVVTRGEVPAEVRQHMLLWVGCIAGALQDSEYAAKLRSAGFEGVDIEPTRVYNIEDARTFLSGQGLDVDALAPQVEGKFMSAFVRATKPKAAACCAPGCCS